MLKRVLTALCAISVAATSAVHAETLPILAPFEAPPSVDWVSTLSAELPARLDVQGKRVLVLSQRRDAVHSAVTRALRTALSGAGAQAVLSENAAPSVVGKRDAEALAATAALPVDLRVFVRVIGNSGAQTAVLSAYDASGALVATANLAEKRAAAVTPTTSAAPRQGPRSAELNAAIAEYKRRYIWAEGLILVDRYGECIESKANYYQGRARRVMTPGEIYLETKALAQHTKIQANIEAYRWTVIGQTSAATALFAAMVAAGVALTVDENFQLREDQVLRTAGTALLSVSAFGVLLAPPIGIGMLRHGHDGNWDFMPEPPHQLHLRIKAHNVALAKELGLENVSGLPDGLERLQSST